MKKKILFLLLLFLAPLSKINALDISYQSHVQQKGWMDWVQEGELSGTTGQSLRMEAIKINVENGELPGDLLYQVHVQQKGWMDWVKGGEIAGTTGQSLRMEAIRIKLTGELAEKYKIIYRSHVQQEGWMDWVEEGELSGTTGQGLRMEALEIKYIEKNSVSINTSIHNVDGWTSDVKNGEIAGTTGQGKRIDCLKVSLINTSKYSGDLNYSLYTSKNGWTDYALSNQDLCSNNENIEALKFKLTGELADNYDVYYRVHVANFGWLDWTKNDLPSGTEGWFKRIEAVQIKIVEKTSNEITTGPNSFKKCVTKLTYQSHVQQKGWMDWVSDGELSGTTGQGLRMEAYKINVSSEMSGQVQYSTYVQGIGWQGFISSSDISGTTGQGKKIEVVAIKLTGELAVNYDIYYRVHVSQIGWMGWTKNGNNAGSMNSDTRVEAIQIKLVRKDDYFDTGSNKAYVTGKWEGNKYIDYFGNISTGFKFIDGIKYYFNSEGTLYGKNVKKVIDVSTWQGTIDWDTIKSKQDVDESIIRVGWGTDDGAPCGTDNYFDRNIKEVQRLNIPYGIYIYAYANTVQYAEMEADFVVAKMKEYNMPKDTWVWYDAELKYISRDTYNKVIPAFINRVKAAGYKNVGVYSGVSQLDTTNGNTNTSTIRSYPIWVAQYYKHLQYTGTYKGWQFSSQEHIDGIDGNVDVSMFFK